MDAAAIVALRLHYLAQIADLIVPKIDDKNTIPAASLANHPSNDIQVVGPLEQGQSRW
jgi:hypothetical protein